MCKFSQVLLRLCEWVATDWRRDLWLSWAHRAPYRAHVHISSQQTNAELYFYLDMRFIKSDCIGD